MAVRSTPSDEYKGMIEQPYLWSSGIGLGLGMIAGLTGVVFRRRSISRRAAATSGPNTTFVFSGSLKQTSLIDAIQFLEIGRRQGVLHVYCGRRKGYLTFLEGKVVDGFYRNQTGREAVFTMLDLAEGDFYFEPTHVKQPRMITDSLLDLTMEWDSRKGVPE